MDTAAAPVVAVETVEDTEKALPRAARTRSLPRTRPLYGEQWQRSVAHQRNSSAVDCTVKRLLRLFRPPNAVQLTRSTSRTAVCGPACTVVWEGRSREAPPYPDRG